MFDGGGRRMRLFFGAGGSDRGADFGPRTQVGPLGPSLRRGGGVLDRRGAGGRSDRSCVRGTGGDGRDGAADLAAAGDGSE